MKTSAKYFGPAVGP